MIPIAKLILYQFGLQFQRKKMKIGDGFETYAALEAALKAYEKEVFTNFFKSHSKKMKPGKFGGVEIEKFGYEYIYYCCKHGGENISSATQRATSSYKVGCKSFIRVKFDTVHNVLRVSNMLNVHNHELQKNFFDTIPNQRRLNEQEKKMVNSLISVKANPKAIQSMLNKDRNAGVILKDLHNMKQKARTGNVGIHGNVLEAMIGELTKFNDNVGNTIKILTDDEEQFQGIYFQDERMRTYFQYYPETLLIDATYRLNDRQMPLTLLAIIDGNGETQIVALFLVKSECFEITNKMLQWFKTDNKSHAKIEVILADKHFAQRQALTDAFTNAKIQICIFHVLQIFKREVTCKKRNISQNECSKAIELLTSMVYADSRYAYTKLYNELLKMNCPELNDYFNNHWHEVREEWSAAYTNANFNLLNRTTNRIESINQKLKTVVTRNGAAPTFVAETVKCLKSLNFERDYRNITSYLKQPALQFDVHTPEYEYQKLLTKFAFGKLYAEFQIIDEFAIKDVGDSFLTYGGCSGISRLTFENNCGCRFFTSMRLPCKHILKFRKMRGYELFEPNMCSKRWLKSNMPFNIMNTRITSTRNAANENTQNVDTETGNLHIINDSKTEILVSYRLFR